MEAARLYGAEAPRTPWVPATTTAEAAAVRRGGGRSTGAAATGRRAGPPVAFGPMSEPIVVAGRPPSGRDDQREASAEGS